jgi:hypothetical protein
MPFPSASTTKEATVWPVDLAPSAEVLSRHPQASISSVRLAAGLKRKHLSSDIRKNNCPAEQYTPPKTTAHYTISKDCTAGFEARKMQLFAGFEKKCQRRKNHFGHLANMHLGPDDTYRQTDTTERKVSRVAGSSHARLHILNPVHDRTTMQAQQLSQKTVNYYPRSSYTNIWVSPIMRKAEPSSSKEVRGMGKSCRFCGYIPQCDTRLFRDYMAKHMKSLHPETQQILPCPYPGCTRQFSRPAERRKHQAIMGHDVEDEDLGMQKRQRIEDSDVLTGFAVWRQHGNL